jgi:hypothetical protein
MTEKREVPSSAAVAVYVHNLIDVAAGYRNVDSPRTAIG